jgi:hypothetical protein
VVSAGAETGAIQLEPDARCRTDRLPVRWDGFFVNWPHVALPLG